MKRTREEALVRWTCSVLLALACALTPGHARAVGMRVGLEVGARRYGASGFFGLGPRLGVSFGNDHGSMLLIEDTLVLLPARSSPGTDGQILLGAGYTTERLAATVGALLALYRIPEREAPATEGNEDKGKVGTPTVFCREPDIGAVCADRCIAKGVPCGAIAAHPLLKKGGGTGKLYACNDKLVGHICSYTYPNGDNCHYFFGFPMVPVCVL